MTSQLVGPLYRDVAAVPRKRLLTVYRDGRLIPASTDEEAVEALQYHLTQTYIEANLEIQRVTKVTTTTDYEDVTHLYQKIVCDELQPYIDGSQEDV